MKVIDCGSRDECYRVDVYVGTPRMRPGGDFSHPYSHVFSPEVPPNAGQHYVRGDPRLLVEDAGSELDVQIGRYQPKAF